ncbi:NAC domain-containing protein 90 [Vitis vinifera]|uniref:NAC domain-containing protein 90 n=1 Tax=Vitis vinifera TaxID=29760 RepID=A0A438FF50_VITVI|nr:NAC domain-containing protein 90 [Vitis vinifera]
MKLQGKRLQELNRVIPDVNIYELEPWHLPRLSGEVCRRDTEQWFFFIPRQAREVQGGRPSRTTGSGYWKATGSPSYVYSSDNRVIGVKKTMVFYNGKALLAEKLSGRCKSTEPLKQMLPQSLSRVYVISGSFRAFDRRPLASDERRTSQQVRRQHAAAAAAAAAAVSSDHVQDTQMMEKRSSSPECSYSGGYDHVHLQASSAPIDDFLWDWGQLDWL